MPEVGFYACGKPGSNGGKPGGKATKDKENLKKKAVTKFMLGDRRCNLPDRVVLDG